jgi:MFS family permease
VTDGHGAWAPERRLLTAGLIGLITAAAFEGMAVPTVLPATVDELGGLDLYGWAFSAFWLTNIIGITLGGGDADRHGPGRALGVGVALFAAGLLVAGAATGMPLVIAGRAIQGFGSGAIGAVVYAVIARAYHPSARPRMIALISSAWVVPGLVGPALAGLVTDAFTWRWVFLGIVPPLVLMGAAVFPRLRGLGPVPPSDAPTRSGRRRAGDAVQLAVGSTLLLAALSVGAVLPAAGLVLVGGWLAVRALRHLLPPGSLRLAPGRPSVMAATFAVAFAFFGTEAFIPLTIVEVQGGSVTLGGLALSAAAVTWAAGAWLQARGASAGRRRTVVTSGVALILVGIGVTSIVLLPGSSWVVAAVGWGIAGLGMGLAYSMLALLVLETAPRGQEGVSSAALQLMFTLGTAFGAGTGGAIIALADAGQLALPTAVGVVNGIMLLAAALAGLVALRVPRSPADHPTSAGSAVPVPLEHP